MPRRAWITLAVAALFAASAFSPFLASASAGPLISPPFELAAGAALLVEPSTGAVIFEKNADQPLPVASVSKIMTLTLILDAVDDGRLKPDQPVTVSANAAATKGSEAFLDSGGVYPASELIKSIVVASANDSCVALAEHLYGSEEAFVAKMNERAQKQGLANTRFVNSTGLPVTSGESNRMSAKDAAALSAPIVTRSLYAQYATVWITDIEHKNGRKTELVNTNRLVRFYSGTDGVKTGSTTEAGYCVSASAVQGDMRLIAVVLGSKNSKDRFDLASRMLKYGFDHYELRPFVKAGEVLRKDVPVKRGGSAVDIVAGKAAGRLTKKGETENIELRLEIPETLAAPLNPQKPVGRIVAYLDGAEIGEVPAYPSTGVSLPGYYEALMRIMERWSGRRAVEQTIGGL